MKTKIVVDIFYSMDIPEFEQLCNEVLEDIQKLSSNINSEQILNNKIAILEKELATLKETNLKLTQKNQELQDNQKIWAKRINQSLIKF